jgi:fatty acid desaturase
MHGAVFASPAANDRVGQVLCWLSGAGIADYATLKEKHLRHHADRLDVVSFDYRAILRAAPAWFRRSILVLEWAYVPAVELLMRGLILRRRWRASRAARNAVIVALAGYAVAFALLAAVSLQALLLYIVAYMLFLHVLRFQDAFQHTFDVHCAETLQPAPRHLVKDRAYEHANTYSDVVSVGHPLLNLLVLNFAYHNAHHARPAEPWYRLERLHRHLYAADDAQVLPVSALLANYHRYRVRRVMAPDYGAVGPAGVPAAERARGFLGAVGVSFLTAG